MPSTAARHDSQTIDVTFTGILLPYGCEWCQQERRGMVVDVWIRDLLSIDIQ
jgi:hypothetical protein